MTWCYAFDERPASDPERRLALLGGKGANLAVMASELGLPVPPGFTITTEACRAYLSGGWPRGLDEEIRAQLRGVEAAAGRRFGDPGDPLLVSVRSGAPVSMPGMLDTILDLGLDDATTAGLARVSGDRAFAASCRQRFEAMYRRIVGTESPREPWAQLRGAIEAVFRSWLSPRARAYREREGIAPDLGTAVTVQAMVFGDRGPESATGVVFTRDPATGEDALYGDVLFRSQGEDVVGGTHSTQPINALDERLPTVAAELRRVAARLERHSADSCDIEFTVEEGRLWILQYRIGKRSPQAALRMALEMAEDPTFPLSRAEAVRRVARILADPPSRALRRRGGAPVVARGLGVSPGLACGEIATTPDAAARRAAEGRSVILVRATTSPDDVHGMARAAGVLTTTGGLASHAAVVARGWGIPAVVGASGIAVADGVVTIGGRPLGHGEVLGLDGSTGEVFGGSIEWDESVVPEVATLLAWAREEGIEIGALGEEAGTTSAPAMPGRSELTAAALVHALLIKGSATPDPLAPALRSTREETLAALERLAAEGSAERADDLFHLTVAGRAIATAAVADDRRRLGADAADAALDGFLALDRRTKEIVTAWQVRLVEGRQVLNDHADAVYDAGVLADLLALRADAVSWIEALAVAVPRLASYGARLDLAAARALEGDHRYIASPRVDSFHGIWFELHEDLILLAGRTRADEVAAGRA